MDITYKTQASFVANQFEVLGNIYPSYVNTEGMVGLKDSMNRIKDIDDPTEALQDHFNAMSNLSKEEIQNLKALPGNVFTMCEGLLKLLIASGARFNVTS